MTQFDIYHNPGLRKAEIPHLVVVQDNHITSRTGAAVVIPLRANACPVETMAPLIDLPGKGRFVLSADERYLQLMSPD